MTAIEAIPKVAELTISLIERVKDGKTATLVSQIQALNQTVQSGYFAAEKEAAELRSKINDLKTEHQQKVTELEREIARLNSQLKQPNPKIWPTPKRSKLNHNF
jgi:hypothetical protein